MRTVLLLFLLSTMGFTHASAKDRLQYYFEFLPEKQAVDVRITVPGRLWLKRAEFDLSDHQISELEYSGEFTRGDSSAVWRPEKTKDGAYLKYRVKINNIRSSGSYDAYISKDWALLRGEDLIPPVSIVKRKGADVGVTMTFSKPKHWAGVNTGWERLEDQSFAIVNPRYTFPRPAGWIIAGDLGTRHEQLGRTQISISAPKGHDFKQMEMLTFINMVWPHLAAAIDINTPKILITGAGEPMWRGGLSGPNSLYIHTGRPLVSENGTSTIIHELFHVVGDIDSAKHGDWIIEGLAEFYSVEVLYRAGGMTAERRTWVFDSLRDWSKDVETLLVDQSKGPVTARATVLFDELDAEIKTRSGGEHCLDHLLKKIQGQKSLNAQVLRDAYRELMGEPSKVLSGALVKNKAVAGGGSRPRVTQ